jgi:hypothetical protein
MTGGGPAVAAGPDAALVVDWAIASPPAPLAAAQAANAAIAPSAVAHRTLSPMAVSPGPFCRLLTAPLMAAAPGAVTGKRYTIQLGAQPD